MTCKVVMDFSITPRGGKYMSYRPHRNWHAAISIFLWEATSSDDRREYICSRMLWKVKEEKNLTNRGHQILTRSQEHTTVLKAIWATYVSIFVVNFGHGTQFERNSAKLGHFW